MRIVALETIVPGERSQLPALVFVRVHTDDGLVGCGETYYTPRAVSTYIHEFLAPLVMGMDAAAPDAIWETAYRAAARFGGKGLELRALSAVDIAVWDLVGQAAQLPLYRVLGGPVRATVPAYNTCGGSTYGRAWRPGYGDASEVGDLDDAAAFLLRPAELARELIDEGFAGMKIWPFDIIAQEHGGQTIEASAVARGLEPFRLIREAVGRDIEIMAEGHGYWSLGAAKVIAKGLEPFEPAWIEDLMLADCPESLAELKRSTSIPVLASEYLMTRFEHAAMIRAGAVDHVMIDPSWCGGITESQRIVALARAAQLPVTMHDCTGPFTLLAGIHLASSAPNATYQEVVRAYLRMVYPDFVDDRIELVDGHIVPPERPGIGAELKADLVDRAGVEQRWSRLDPTP
jgi:L-alanine-DL-glutamate epimerase-like enolase superfamily enzyme